MLPLTTLAAALLTATAVGAAIVTVRDRIFDDAEWTAVFTTFSSGGGALGGGGVVATQDTSEGRPAPARRIALTLPPAPSESEYSNTFSAHFPTGFVYDPMTQGPIATIDYEEDARAPDSAQLTGLALRQGGEVYFVQASVFTSPAWTRVARTAIVTSNFEHMTADGVVQGEYPDLTAAGGPIEVGFLRANSTGAGRATGFTNPALIDNWTVRLNPPCTIDAECDDGDPCATEACVAGACRSTPLACDDGDGCTTDACAGGTCSHTPVVCDDTDACTVDACLDGSCAHAPIDCDDAETCTVDACVGGSCVHTPFADIALVEGKVDALLAIVSGSCAGEPLVKKVGRKLKKKLRKARAKLAAADATTRATLVDKLLGKSETLLAAADDLLASAAAAGLLSPACATELEELLDSVRACAAAASGS